MSSRGSLIGNTPASGLYEAPVTPQDPEDLPVYVSDELLHLGGIVNGVLEGGAFPPTAKMPQRWREGMMIYFTTALEDRYKDTNDIIIRGAGVWLYRKGRWWKIIDDPSEVVRGVYVFQTGDESPPPSPGITLENPPTGWTEEPQVKDRDEWIWACPLLRYDSETGEYEWGIPVAWSTGVVDALTPVFRYIAAGSSQAPIISNPYGREPITTEGESFSENIPPLDHPNGKDAIYMTQAGVDTFSDIVINPWSDPTRFSTPDQTTYHKAWAVGTDWDDSYPSFNPNASGLPGSDWSHTQPASTREFPIWVTERLEWPDGTSQTIWTTPTYWNAQDGVNGAPGVPGIEGDLYEQWFLESVGNPGTPSSTYPPTGGWEDTTPVNPTNGVWMSFLRRNEETGAASYPWSYPILISGVAGEPGIPGTDGSVFTPWYKASASFPGVPPSGVYPPAGWTQDTSTLTGTIWVTTVLVNEAGDTQGAYTYPIQWNGLDGLDGLDGTDGADGQRGTVSVQATGGSWNNTTAYNAIVSATGGAPVDWDVVTISNSSFVETRRYAGGGNPGTWSVLDLVVDGDAVITGTVGGERPCL